MDVGRLKSYREQLEGFRVESIEKVYNPKVKVFEGYVGMPEIGYSKWRC